MKRKPPFQLVFADSNGKVFHFPELEAAGMEAGKTLPVDPRLWIKLPPSSELFALPDRLPVGLDPEKGSAVTLDQDPYFKKAEKCSAVAAFLPPGYTLTHNTAYRETEEARLLPLFAYGACGFRNGQFYAAAIRVDKSLRHDERLLDMDEVRKNAKHFEKLFPKNRLIRHLADCATLNACANAKNFFLGRLEAPIPTSPACNAQCQGCISFQPPGRVPPTQRRISFTPTPEEIAEVALFHFKNERDPLLSFGQGCEGEPTLAADVIERSIHLIRKKTSRGILNINTNASRPLILQRLFAAGLNNIRVSLNSMREPYYSRYYQPRGYSLREVRQSIDIAKKYGGFVSLNYLSMPGFTDSREEFLSFKEFLEAHQVDMIQWRNLNYDPLQYFRDLGLEAGKTEILGMSHVIQEIRKEFPGLLMGYFNPRKSAMGRRLARRAYIL